MREWIKRWLFKGELVEDTRPAYEALRHQGSIQAYKINNGYVVRVMQSDMYLNDGRVPSLHFCKDHTEIAEHIITQSAIQKLCGEQQMELPLDQPMTARLGSTRQTIF